MNFRTMIRKRSQTFRTMHAYAEIVAYNCKFRSDVSMFKYIGYKESNKSKAHKTWAKLEALLVSINRPLIDSAEL